MRANPEDAPARLREAAASGGGARVLFGRLPWFLLAAVTIGAVAIVSFQVGTRLLNPAMGSALVNFIFLIAAILLVIGWRIALIWIPRRRGVFDAATQSLTFERFRMTPLVYFLGSAAFTCAVFTDMLTGAASTTTWLFGIALLLVSLNYLHPALLAHEPLVIDGDGISGLGWSGRPIPWAAVERLEGSRRRGSFIIKLWLKAPGSYAMPERFALIAKRRFRLAMIVTSWYLADEQVIFAAIEKHMVKAKVA